MAAVGVIAVGGIVIVSISRRSDGATAALTSSAPDATNAGAPNSEATSSSRAQGSDAPVTAAPTIEAPIPPGGMSLAIRLNPRATWDDGSQITSKDLECTYRATLNTPGSLNTAGYDRITRFDSSDPETAVVTFSERYASYKTLFSGIIKADAVSSCDDVSADFQTSIPFSGRPWKQESWTQAQAVLVPNRSYWVKEDIPTTSRVVMLPKPDSGGEIDALRSGEVGMIYPQAFAGITAALTDPNIEYTPGYGTNYEGLYFQQLDGPFKDPVFRAAFSMSIDRDLILRTIYDPIFPGSELLQCGLWVPTIGMWCDNTQFAKSYDPAAAEKLLTDNGWRRGADGYWADANGNVPTIRWMVNNGNRRREDTQNLMIPDLAKAGFRVVADNSETDTVLQKRLPTFDYDLAMYIAAASPDPSVTAIMACGSIPSTVNNNWGKNWVGWCNPGASALMRQSDEEVNESARVDQIHRIGQYLVDDHVMLPLYQFRNVAAWRTDKVGGPVDADASNYRGPFNNLEKWQSLGGTDIAIGAEVWPECLNPITSCAGSAWQFWTVNVPLLPSVWDTTAAGFATTALVIGEPEVTVG